MKNVTLLERQLRNATSARALTPVFLPDGKSCLFYGNQQLLTVDTVSELIAGLFLTVHNNSQISSILIAFPNGVFDEKFYICSVRMLYRAYYCGSRYICTVSLQ